MTALDEALILLRDRLEADLDAALGDQPGHSHVALTNPFKADGSAVSQIDRLVLLTLVGVHIVRPQTQPPARLPGQVPEPRSESSLAADVLITANLQRDYAQGVKKLSLVIAALERNPVLVMGRRPGRGEGRDPITAEFVELEREEAAALVAQAGVKGMPFALYRLRGIPLGD